MHYDVEIDGRRRAVAVVRHGDGLAVTVDGRPWSVDAVCLDEHTLSLILGGPSPEGDTGYPLDRLGRASVYDVDIEFAADQFIARVGSAVVSVRLDGRQRRAGAPGRTGSGPQRVTAPMPGKVVRVLVRSGEAVSAGQSLIVVEAMKMENELRAERDATVSQVLVSEGASVEAGALLVELA
jgi:biotin carboxyl carrier protein